MSGLGSYPPFDGTQVCAQVDAELFFPVSRPLGTVIRLCESCPFQEPCLDYALHHAVVGIWGGTTEGQRKRIRERLGIVPIRLELSDIDKTHVRIRELLAAGWGLTDIAREVGVSEPVVYRQRDAWLAERGAA